jgi:hypothetical protein
MERLRLWQQAAIAVRGRPEWLFIKLCCHGMDPRDEQALLGSPIQQFLLELVGRPQRQDEYQVHFVTAREMVNIALAACDGRSGNPGQYRDYRFQLIRAPSGNESLFLASTGGKREPNSHLGCPPPEERSH